MGRPWSEHDRVLMTAIRDTIPNISWKQIGWKFGRSPGACSTEYWRQRQVRHGGRSFDSGATAPAVPPQLPATGSPLPLG